MRTTVKLNQQAKDTLRQYGITQAAWLRLYPSCDQCGCPDDRCIGYHHDEDDDCDLRYWIEGDEEAGRITPAMRTAEWRRWYA